MLCCFPLVLKMVSKYRYFPMYCVEVQIPALKCSESRSHNVRWYSTRHETRISMKSSKITAQIKTQYILLLYPRLNKKYTDI